MNSTNQAHSSKRAVPEERLEFETFLADISARLVTLYGDQVDDEVRSALKKVLRFFQIDRCLLLRLLSGKSLFQVAHNALAHGIAPYPVGAPPGVQT